MLEGIFGLTPAIDPMSAKSARCASLEGEPARLLVTFLPCCDVLSPFHLILFILFIA